LLTVTLVLFALLLFARSFLRHQTRHTLFPYTTLFRSIEKPLCCWRGDFRIKNHQTQTPTARTTRNSARLSARSIDSTKETFENNPLKPPFSRFSDSRLLSPGFGGYNVEP